ncbi:MGMT family protein [Thermomonas sp.]|uniref:MGMT family protein n=1 Tax=Thermomonas sp. TaxID=1971895 RepID=UPI00262F0478|nr:MGMT family protein [Thermomonas sp.]
MVTPEGNDSTRQRILDAIRAVPRGEVASYGGIARRSGLPGRARLVARVLGENDDADLPWHRILRADGRIAFAAGSRPFREQAKRLRAEGVAVRNGRVQMAEAEETLDAAVWAPR